MLIHQKNIFREDNVLYIALVLSVLNSLPNIYLSTVDTGGNYYTGRAQLLRTVYRNFVSHLTHEELRHLIRSLDASINEVDTNNQDGFLHHSQEDLGGMLGESSWRHGRIRQFGTNTADNYHHISGFAHGFDQPHKSFDSIYNNIESASIMNRLNALSNGSASAWLNGFLESNNLHSNQSSTTTNNTAVSNSSSFTSKKQRGSHLAGDSLDTEDDSSHGISHRDVQAYVLHEQSVSANNSSVFSSSSRNDPGHSNPTPPHTPPLHPRFEEMTTSQYRTSSLLTMNSSLLLSPPMYNSSEGSVGGTPTSILEYSIPLPETLAEEANRRSHLSEQPRGNVLRSHGSISSLPVESMTELRASNRAILEEYLTTLPFINYTYLEVSINIFTFV